MSRAGNFTSSEIHRLMSSGRAKGSIGAPFYSYVKEKNWERKLGRGLSSDTNARPSNWGLFVEKRAFDLLPLNYKLMSDIRFHHPVLPWSGMPDILKENDLVGDIKCPWTLNSFCKIVDAFEEGIEGLKKTSPEYYWQLVSNAILTECPKAALWVYVPYQSELEEIRHMANYYTGDQNKIAFINWAPDDDLPYLVEGSQYKNLNSFEFTVPEEDIEALTERVKEASKLLIPAEHLKVEV